MGATYSVNNTAGYVNVYNPLNNAWTATTPQFILFILPTTTAIPDGTTILPDSAYAKTGLQFVAPPMTAIGPKSVQMPSSSKYRAFYTVMWSGYDGPDVYPFIGPSGSQTFPIQTPTDVGKSVVSVLPPPTHNPNNLAPILTVKFNVNLGPGAKPVYTVLVEGSGAFNPVINPPTGNPSFVPVNLINGLSDVPITAQLSLTGSTTTPKLVTIPKNSSAYGGFPAKISSPAASYTISPGFGDVPTITVPQSAKNAIFPITISKIIVGYVNYIVNNNGSSYTIIVSSQDITVTNTMLASTGTVLVTCSLITPTGYTVLNATNTSITLNKVPSGVPITIQPIAASGLLVDAFPAFSFPKTPMGDSSQASTVFYAQNTPVAYKAFASSTFTCKNSTTVTYKITNVDTKNLGFAVDTFGNPPRYASQPFPGFYQGSAFSLVPGAVFQIQDLTGHQRLKQNSSSVSYTDTDWKNPKNVVNVENMYSFAECSPGRQQLIALSATATHGYMAVSSTFTPIPISDACQLNSEWGILQVYQVTDSVPSGVILMYRDDLGTKVFESSTLKLADTYASLDFDTVPGFVSGSYAALNAFNLFLLTDDDMCKVPAAYMYNCWTVSPYGCNGADCPLSSTQAGGNMCTKLCNITGNASYQQGAKDFVTSACATHYDSGCISVAGGDMSAGCSGWTRYGLSQPCASACETLDDGFCDSQKITYCQSPGNANVGDCSCVNLGSTFKVPERNNMSYDEYTNYIETRFGLPASTELYGECWWPTCAETGAGGGIRLSKMQTQCPTDIVECVDVISDITSSDSNININVKNICSASDSSGSSNGGSSASSAACTDSFSEIPRKSLLSGILPSKTIDAVNTFIYPLSYLEVLIIVIALVLFLTFYSLVMKEITLR
jgi:hypothetical protein